MHANNIKSEGIGILRRRDGGGGGFDRSSFLSNAEDGGQADNSRHHSAEVEEDYDVPHH